jgi:GABA(A) receptor-associated protein
MDSSFLFKKKFSLEKRQEESKKIREKYENKIPLIVEPAKSCTLNKIDKCKFLVPDTMTLAQFLFVLRRRVNLDESEALFLFVDKSLPPTTSLLGQLYEEKKNDDGFLYLSYCNESTFGN